MPDTNAPGDADKNHASNVDTLWTHRPDAAGVFGLIVLPASLLPLFRGWQADFSYKNERISPAFAAGLPIARIFGTGGKHPDSLGETPLLLVVPPSAA